jgi:glycosyltransferase involved in cell wall biosynthesis
MLRSAKWAIRILAAAVAGALVRTIRRLLGRPPRIWHGFWPLHTAADHALVDRLAGYPSHVVALQLSHIGYEIYQRERFDVVWEDLGVPPPDRHWKSLEHLLRHGDIWIAFFDCLFFPGRNRLNEISFRLIRLAGIRIIAVTQGGDVVHRPRWVTRFDWVGRFQASYPNWDLEQQVPVARQRIDTFCRYADLVIADGAYTARFLPRVDLCFKYFPVDIETFRPPAEEDSHDTAVIVHATNHRPVKGTDFVLESVARLQQLGAAVDLRVVERVPRMKALEIYRSADVAADQFCMGSFGCFAMECMAMGKTVVSYSDQEELGLPQFSLPLVNGTRDNLDEVFAVLVALPELRERIGRASRIAAERQLSFAPLAEVWSRIYEHVWRGASLNLADTAVFDATRPTRPFTEDPSRADFWPVDVTDLLPRIQEIVENQRKSRPSP